MRRSDPGDIINNGAKYPIGEIADGHIWNGHTWEPLISAHSTPTYAPAPWYRRPLALAVYGMLAIAAIVGIATVGDDPPPPEPTSQE